MSRDIKQVAKMSWSKGIEIIQSLFSYHCGIMLEINIKRYLKITHTFTTAIWHLPREIFDLAIESLNKVKDWKNTEGDCEKKAFKWEINIKDTLKTQVQMIILNITNVTGSQSVLKGLLVTLEAVSGPGYWSLWPSLCPCVGLDAACQPACLQTLGSLAEAKFWTGNFSFPKLFAECYFLVHGFFSFRNWDTSFVPTWMDPKIVILSEVRQIEKEKYHMTSLICGI